MTSCLYNHCIASIQDLSDCMWERSESVSLFDYNCLPLGFLPTGAIFVSLLLSYILLAGDTNMTLLVALETSYAHLSAYITS